MRSQRDDLRKRINDQKAWTDRYDKQIGPFAATYDSNTASIGGLYSNARKAHGRGLNMLMEEFGYRPMFKKPGDSFTAVPFVPKRL